MLRINEDIKSGQFKRAYLLYGEEDYLRYQFRDRLVKALVNEGDTMNFTRFSGKDISVPQVIDLAETLPFFAERRVILMEDTGFFKGSGEELAKYLEAPAESTVFIFCESEVDGRTKLFKTVSKNGIAAEMKHPSDADMSRWLNGKAAAQGISFASGALCDYFIKRMGPDMMALENELTKLASYLGERDVIQKADIDAVCTPQIQDTIFEMVRCMSQGRKKEAMEHYYSLVLLHKPAMQTLAMLNRQVGDLLQVKDLMIRRRSKKEVAEATGMAPYRAQKTMELAGDFDLPALKDMLNEGISVETDIKSGNLQDTVGVEMLLIRLSDIATESLRKKFRRRN
ncbi:MAG: DNA polymerase III subunit delta [Lachnospiraceae bacterium]|nr:DNA polymerase III subunit delta [Lachnospiraceae bacterium]